MRFLYFCLFALPAFAAEPCVPLESALQTFLAHAPKATPQVPGFTAVTTLREATKLLGDVTGTLPVTSDLLAKAQGSLEASADADVSHLLGIERCPMSELFVVASRAIATAKLKGVTDGDRAALRKALRRWLVSAPDRRLESIDLMTRIAVVEKMHRSGLDPLPTQPSQAFERLQQDAADARRLSVMGAEEWKRSPSRTAYRALDAATRRKLNGKWLEELRAEDALRQRLSALLKTYEDTKPPRRE